MVFYAQNVFYQTSDFIKGKLMMHHWYGSMWGLPSLGHTMMSSWLSGTVDHKSLHSIFKDSSRDIYRHGTAHHPSAVSVSVLCPPACLNRSLAGEAKPSGSKWKYWMVDTPGPPQFPPSSKQRALRTVSKPHFSVSRRYSSLNQSLFNRNRKELLD